MQLELFISSPDHAGKLEGEEKRALEDGELPITTSEKEEFPG